MQKSERQLVSSVSHRETIGTSCDCSPIRAKGVDEPEVVAPFLHRHTCRKSNGAVRGVSCPNSRSAGITKRDPIERCVRRPVPSEDNLLRSDRVTIGGKNDQNPRGSHGDCGIFGCPCRRSLQSVGAERRKNDESEHRGGSGRGNYPSRHPWREWGTKETPSGGYFAPTLPTDSQMGFQLGPFLPGECVAQVCSDFFARGVFAHVFTVEGVCHVVEPYPLIVERTHDKKRTDCVRSGNPVTACSRLFLFARALPLVCVVRRRVVSAPESVKAIAASRQFLPCRNRPRIGA